MEKYFFLSDALLKKSLVKNSVKNSEKIMKKTSIAQKESRVNKQMNEKQDFTTGSIPKKMIGFMLPVLGALILQAMYGAVDLMIVGRFGTTEGISGVTTGRSIMNLVTFYGKISDKRCYRNYGTIPGRETLRENGWTGRRSNVLLFLLFRWF